jgi:hypothetical protein
VEGDWNQSMFKTAVVLNWIIIALLAVSFIGLYRINPNRVSPWNLFMLAPYMAALMAFRKDTRPAARYVAVALNALMLILYSIIIVGMMIGGIPRSLIAIVFVILIGVVPNILNIYMALRYQQTKFSSDKVLPVT